VGHDISSFASAARAPMSAIGGKADIARSCRNVPDQGQTHGLAPCGQPGNLRCHSGQRANN
jgi:hypothetical protein